MDKNCSSLHVDKDIDKKISNNPTPGNEIRPDPLDAAMEEFLEICQQYEGGFTDKQEARQVQTQYNKETNLSKFIQPKQTCDQPASSVINRMTSVTSKSIPCPNRLNSLEQLQEKQSELQSQLDEVLRVAKELDDKQKRRHQANVANPGNHDSNDEEAELIEFQKIENELRVSDINRKLINIQEELRIRLYKRLMLNTNNPRNRRNPNLHLIDNLGNRRGSNGDESSPSSSSCSEEQALSSQNSICNLNFNHTNNSKILKKSELYHPPPSNSINCVSQYESFERSQNSSEEVITNEVASNDTFEVGEQLKTLILNDKSRKTELTEENGLEYDSSTLTTSRESVISSKKSTPSEISNIHSNLSAMSNVQSCNSYVNSTSLFPSSPTCPSNLRNSSANSDLERIDEDEEDGQDCYFNSDHFRTIYEEKLSPILRNHLSGSNQAKAAEGNNKDALYTYKSKFNEAEDKRQASVLCLTKASHSRSNDEQYDKHPSFNSESMIGRNPAVNRPLTMYLPKANEEIDLLDHIQVLGHDLDIISDDLKLDANSAQGYLWKCCSNKKWLKRFFHFDRSSRLLSYSSNEASLVKTSTKAKRNVISFDDINDVYVDHKLSGKGDKEKCCKKHYVFVLATEGRKYLLASSRAETMRAWIDVLFTAAKANEYFQLNGENIEEVHDNRAEKFVS